MQITDNLDELFVVVDKDDNIIDYKTRKECHSNKKLIHRRVQILLTDKSGRLLLQKRSMTKDLYPGMITLSASGHVSKGESYQQTAEREMGEEIGIITSIIPVKKYLFYAPTETEYSTIFIGEAKSEPIISKNEVEEILYVQPSEIPKYLNKLTPIAKKGLKILDYF